MRRPSSGCPVAEVVVDVETGEHPGGAPARLVHAQQFGHGVAQRLVPIVGRC